MSKKIKVFLGAFVNQTNSQNLSCRALALHIDPTKFEVYCLQIHHGNLSKITGPAINTFTCFYPVKITALLGYCWGIYNADVCYLVRGNLFRWEKLLLKLFKRKSFKTIEIIFDDTSFASAARIYRNIDLKDAFSHVNKSYSLSQYMRHYNMQKHSLLSEKQVVPLVNDTSHFSSISTLKYELREVLFLGNDFKRKGVVDYLHIAKQFPTLTFHLIGRGDGFTSSEIKSLLPENVKWHGMLSHDSMIKVVYSCQLHILPSHSEGFPKVIIEMAAAGLPTLTYADYGANEWIQHGKNGFVVEHVEQMAEVINLMKNNSDMVKQNSQGAMLLAKDFELTKVVKIYENIVEELYDER